MVPQVANDGRRVVHRLVASSGLQLDNFLKFNRWQKAWFCKCIAAFIFALAFAKSIDVDNLVFDSGKHHTA